jgi:hypothetical protein
MSLNKKLLKTILNKIIELNNPLEYLDNSGYQKPLAVSSIKGEIVSKVGLTNDIDYLNKINCITFSVDRKNINVLYFSIHRRDDKDYPNINNVDEYEYNKKTKTVNRKQPLEIDQHHSSHHPVIPKDAKKIEINNIPFYYLK